MYHPYMIIAAVREPSRRLDEHHDNPSNLVKAIQEGNLSSVVTCLENGSDVNEQAENEYLNTPLHHAVANYNLDIFKMLIDHGANVHIKNAKNQDLLTICCLRKSELIFEYLVQQRQVFNFSAHQVADGYELMGSIYHDNLLKTRYFWNRAANFRAEHALIPKLYPHHIFNDNQQNEAAAFFANCPEFTTINEVNNMQLEDVIMQSALIKLRILGPGNRNENIHPVLLRLAIEMGSSSARYLNVQLKFIKMLLKSRAWFTFAREMLDYLKAYTDDSFYNELSFSDQIDLVNLLVTEYDNICCTNLSLALDDEPAFDECLNTILSMFFRLHRKYIRICFEIDGTYRLWECVAKALRSYCKASGGDTLLNVIILNMASGEHLEEKVQLIKLFMDCSGTEGGKIIINAVDCVGDSALIRACTLPYNYFELIKLFLDEGGNMHLKNDRGESAYSLLLANPNNPIDLKKYETFTPPTLKYLTANYILKKDIEYPEGEIPDKLITYLNNEKSPQPRYYWGFE